MQLVIFPGVSESDVILLKGDSVIQTDEKHKLTFEGQICTLTFESVSTSDQGPYCIKVKDAEVTGGEVQVKVKEIPKVQVLPDKQYTNLKEGEMFELKWKITGLGKIFTTQSCLLTTLRLFKTFWEKEENARNQHFLLFPKCFYPIKNRNYFGNIEIVINKCFQLRPWLKFCLFVKSSPIT